MSGKFRKQLKLKNTLLFTTLFKNTTHLKTFGVHDEVTVGLGGGLRWILNYTQDGCSKIK